MDNGKIEYLGGEPSGPLGPLGNGTMKKFAIYFGLMSGLAAVANAATNNCGTPVDNSGPPFGNPSTPITLATANAYGSSDLGAGAGCQIVNAVFDNFAVSGTNFGTAPTTSNVTLLGTFTVGATGLTERMAFAPSTAADWSNTADNTRTLTIDYNGFHPNAFATRGISGVGITVSSYNSGSSTNDVVTLQVLVCNSTLVIPCTAGASLFNTTYTVTVDGLNTFAGANFAQFASGNMSIRLIASWFDGSSSSGVAVTGFYVDFLDAPEPSTFGLLGASLVGLAFLARRRRRA